MVWRAYGGENQHTEWYGWLDAHPFEAEIRSDGKAEDPVPPETEDRAQYISDRYNISLCVVYL